MNKRVFAIRAILLVSSVLIVIAKYWVMGMLMDGPC